MLKYCLILFLYPVVCFPETSLWSISKNGNQLYLGGTIHVLKKTDYPLPVEFSQAFKISDKLVFEANIDKTNTPEFGQKVAQMLTYPPGQSLKQAINKQTFHKLKKYLAARNIPIEQFLIFKPAMVVLVLTVIEFKRIGMVDIGVDQFFHQKAKQAGKAIAYFETLDQQLGFLQSMGKGKENEMIINTIDDLNQIETTMADIKLAWLKGDEKKMVALTLAEMIRDYPELYKTLLVKRNNNWMPRIEKMLQDRKVELVLVGALHLVGKEGLLQQLRNKGYWVEKFR